MKNDDQHKSYRQQQWHQPANRSREENWGANFGEGARPYGEDYGDDDAEQSRAREPNTPANRNQDIGFTYGSPRQPSQRPDYGRSQIEGHSRGSGVDMGARFNRGYARHGSNLMRERGYMSGDDYDRGSPRYEQNTAFDRISNQSDFGDRSERGSRRQNEERPPSRTGWRDSDHDRDRQISLEDEGNMYGSQFGLHKGKGPKNYKRSDDRIRDEINDRLTDDPWVDAIEIETEVKNGEVILSGKVNDKSGKRRAEDIVESVSGVAHVENRLRFESRESSSSQRW